MGRLSLFTLPLCFRSLISLSISSLCLSLSFSQLADGESGGLAALATDVVLATAGSALHMLKVESEGAWLLCAFPLGEGSGVSLIVPAVRSLDSDRSLIAGTLLLSLLLLYLFVFSLYFLLFPAHSVSFSLHTPEQCPPTTDRSAWSSPRSSARWSCFARRFGCQLLYSPRQCGALVVGRLLSAVATTASGSSSWL